MTGEQIKELVKLTAGNYPNTQGKDLTETSKLWKEVFANTPYELFKKSLLRTFDKAKFWPSVADLKEAIDLVSEERDRETFTARVKARTCPNCNGLGAVSIIQDGEERWGKCLCAAGEAEYKGLPAASVVQYPFKSDGKMMASGEEVEAIDF
jgi:hypothetical protein